MTDDAHHPCRVSIVIPCFNQRDFLAESIQSALRQEVPVHVIVVDDGSTDMSADVAREFPVELVQQANKGLSAARNAGLALVRTPYVLFLDADDQLFPGAVAAALAELESHAEAAFVHGGYDLIDVLGNPTARIEAEAVPDCFAALLRRNYIAMHGTVLYRAAALRDIGGFDENLGACEDYDVYLKLVQQHPYYPVNFIMAGYRQHDTNMSGNSRRMLHWALHVQGKWRDVARTRPEWREAYGEGRRFWRNYYSGYMLHDYALRLKRGSITALPELLKLAFTRPRMAARLAMRPAWRFRALLPRYATGPAILMYHRIADTANDPWKLCVSPDRFAAQIDWLRQYRKVMALDEFVQRRASGTLPRNAVAITFDDGYLCNLDTAAPLLAQRGLPATIFITSEAMAGNGRFWWDELQEIVETATIGKLTLLGQDYALGPCDLGGLQASRRRMLAFMELWRRLRTLPVDGRTREVSSLRRQAGLAIPADDTREVMSVEHLRRLAAVPGITIGGHSRSHPYLTDCDPARLRDEVSGCREDIAAWLGTPPALFAYPHGDHDEATVCAVSDAGFSAACTTVHRLVQPQDHPLCLPRLKVTNDTGRSLARLLVSRSRPAQPAADLTARTAMMTG